MPIRSTERVSIEGLFVAAVNADALVRFDNSRCCAVRDCALRQCERPGSSGHPQQR